MNLPTLSPVAKHVLVIAAIAIVGIGLGAVVTRAFNKPNQQATDTPTKTTKTASNATDTLDLPEGTTRNATVASPKFHWGATLRPELFPNTSDNEKFLPEQFKAMKELGLTTLRTDYNTKNLKQNQQVLDLAKKHGMEVVFIIPFGPNDIWTDKNLYDNSYKYVNAIVKRHKGQVKVWQLGTEVASVALKSGGLHGVDGVDYPEAKYKAVSTWLTAATKATKDADPDAKRLLNDQWVHVGFFDRFIKEGGQFEIIGWNWFSDMGTNIEKPTLDAKTKQTYNLMDKLKSYNKEIWLTEVNRRNGDADGNSKAQADYIETMANYVTKNKSISGFIVFHFIGEQGYGIANLNFDGKAIGEKKPAFATYKKLIEKYR